LAFYWHFLFGLGFSAHFLKSGYLLLKSSKFLFEVCWQFFSKQSYLDREPVALFHMYIPISDGFEQMIHEVV
jgi:hypothetical protein